MEQALHLSGQLRNFSHPPVACHLRSRVLLGLLSIQMEESDHRISLRFPTRDK